MNFVRNMIALMVMAATCTLGAPKLGAAEYVTDCGGCGYQQCRKCPSIAPGVALGTIALVAIIAVALQNQSSGHGHGHF